MRTGRFRHLDFFRLNPRGDVQNEAVLGCKETGSFVGLTRFRLLFHHLAHMLRKKAPVHGTATLRWILKTVSPHFQLTTQETSTLRESRVGQWPISFGGFSSSASSA